MCDVQKALREQTNQKGIEYVIALRTEHAQPVENLSPLSAEEEQLYISYYTKLMAGRGRNKWPPKVVATAVTFVKRFYLYHSCMEHEVDKVVFACLYVAGKVCPRNPPLALFLNRKHQSHTPVRLVYYGRGFQQNV